MLNAVESVRVSLAAWDPGTRPGLGAEPLARAGPLPRTEGLLGYIPRGTGRAATAGSPRDRCFCVRPRSTVVTFLEIPGEEPDPGLRRSAFEPKEWGHRRRDVATTCLGPVLPCRAAVSEGGPEARGERGRRGVNSRRVGPLRKQVNASGVRGDPRAPSMAPDLRNNSTPLSGRLVLALVMPWRASAFVSGAWETSRMSPMLNLREGGSSRGHRSCRFCYGFMLKLHLLRDREARVVSMGVLLHSTELKCPLSIAGSVRSFGAMHIQ